jgi:hypothetical protein
MHNITNPSGFLDTFLKVNSTLYEFFELCREEELSPFSDDDCMRYYVDLGKCCFQAAGQFKRPGEFLDALLDMLRVTFEPSPPGTFFLNSNPAFICEAIPKRPFTLGYLSVVGNLTETFSSMWTSTIATKLAKNGYSLNKATSLYIVVAGSKKRVSCELIGEVHEVTKAGFSAEEVMGQFAGELKFRKTKPRKESYAGFVLDEGLVERLRVSMWLFIEESDA